MSLYIEAARIIQRPRYGGLRGAVFSDASVKSRPEQLYALIIETLKHQEIINEVLDKSGLLEIEKKLTHALALVLVHDFLFNKGGIATSTGPLKESILRHKSRLTSEFTRARLRRGYSTTAALLAAANATSMRFPRWVRVNTLKTTVADVLARHFSDHKPVRLFEELLSEDMTRKTVYVDEFVPGLLGFPASTELIGHALVADGTLFMQDRASCFPAALLAPPEGAVVVDGTAAPGNKTTHLAAIVGKGGRVLAFEKDPKRAKTLEMMVGKAGAEKIVEVRAGADFLLSDPWSETEKKRLAKVSHILLDPSCSGSGIVERNEYSYIPKTAAPPPAPTSRAGKAKKRKGGEKEETPFVKPLSKKEEEEVAKQAEAEEERLRSLSTFQTRIIKHAMRYPGAHYISYSTCSVHSQENEQVVMAVLSSEVAKQRGWRVQKREETGFRHWPRRGLVEECDGDEEIAGGCVRFDPWADGGIGFFVVLFVRDGSVDGWEGRGFIVFDIEH
ncbi:S-adenosyl-L-methionine-dependent methyltransferase [Morchella conica CCBAS932]|uniref:S-adenosyl-L-methionine-dependent methyltransferase n=1 Tax=Morchella conica CCBAS932 TaxID=1392247 RepID=A0A3N4KTE9_9PEZI|nr:S-adenosyl-L-methionine-dependent methyltransferase [Morchella conica CCBAS932]